MFSCAYRGPYTGDFISDMFTSTEHEQLAYINDPASVPFRPHAEHSKKTNSKQRRKKSSDKSFSERRQKKTFTSGHSDCITGPVLKLQESGFSSCQEGNSTTKSALQLQNSTAGCDAKSRRQKSRQAFSDKIDTQFKHVRRLHRGTMVRKLSREMKANPSQVRELLLERHAKLCKSDQMILPSRRSIPGKKKTSNPSMCSIPFSPRRESLHAKLVESFRSSVSNGASPRTSLNGCAFACNLDRSANPHLIQNSDPCLSPLLCSRE